MGCRNMLIVLVLLFSLAVVAACGGGGGSSLPEPAGGGSGQQAVGAGAGTAELTWTAPTTNTDGSALTDLAGFRIHYGTNPGNYTASIDAGDVTRYILTGLADRAYYFVVTAYNSAGTESGNSNEVSKVFP